MLKVRFMAVMLALVLLAGVFGGAAAQDQTIVEIAAGNADFSTLVELVTAAGLVETLSGEGPFTVFAPTNDAFAAVPAAVLEYLAANPAELTRVLTYHVVAGNLLAADVAAASGTSVATVEGGEVAVFVDPASGNVLVDGVTVAATDIVASNGVIHVVSEVLFPAYELPEVDPLSVSGNIIAAGSSTVFPVTERMADRFNEAGFAGTITVDSIGSGAGFERFCVNAETDIANASRPIRDGEVEACAGNGRTPIEFQVGIDPLAIAVSRENTFIDSLTVEQLMGVFSGTFATWADVNPAWPAEAIQLYSPGTDSGTLDVFVEVVMDGNEEPILNAPGIQLSEDDNVLVQGLLGSPYAIGYFGFAYYVENAETLRAVAIEGVEPSSETASIYPLTRPLFIYSDATIMQEKPQVAAFINFYLANVTNELLGGMSAEPIGYVPASRRDLNLDNLEWIVAMGMMGM